MPQWRGGIKGTFIGDAASPTSRTSGGTRLVPASGRPMAIPLLQTGPGGSYTVRYLPRGSRLLALRTDGSGPQATGNPPGFSAGLGGGRSFDHRSPPPNPALTAQHATVGPTTWFDRVLGIDRVQISRQAQ
ncbi:MAG: hypothetical protein ACE10B_04420, partial [Phycisphaerales bacterium]